MCHRTSAASAWRCSCGYEFGQTAERVRELLRDQQTNAWITLIALALLDVAAVAGAVSAAIHGFIVVSALGFTALTLLTVRAVRKLVVTRASLRQLARLDAALPRAILHRR
ncbi:MAG TPA: hypothetical protein VK607_16935 [Kofleriaceae bacterium]|jgi:uncharacterized membrane protein|nr:hypothetical protein [Kofleriaceae bacterium]